MFQNCIRFLAMPTGTVSKANAVITVDDVPNIVLSWNTGWVMLAGRRVAMRSLLVVALLYALVQCASADKAQVDRTSRHALFFCEKTVSSGLIRRVSLFVCSIPHGASGGYSHRAGHESSATWAPVHPYMRGEQGVPT